MEKRVLIANISKVNSIDDMKSNYIGMGHYDIIKFRIEYRNGLNLSQGDRCFLPINDDITISSVGTTAFRFLTMINVLCWEDESNEKVNTLLNNLSLFLRYNTPSNINCYLFRSLDSCDFALLFDTDNYLDALSFVNRCIDIIGNQETYFFTIPMLNTIMVDKKENNDIDISKSNLILNSSLQIRMTIRSYHRIRGLLSENKLFKGLSSVERRLLFGANDIVIDLGPFSQDKVITYYRNVIKNFENYRDALHSAEMEVQVKTLDSKKIGNLQIFGTHNSARIDEDFLAGVENVTEQNSPLRIALLSQMSSLLELKESGFFPSVCQNAIEALTELIKEANYKKNNRTSFPSIDSATIQMGLQVFVEALNVTLQSYLYTDSLMLEFLSTNAEVYAVRNKLAMEYDRFIRDCIFVLEQDQTKRTKYLFKPCLSSSVSVTRIWSDYPPICIISIPTSLMLNSPNELLFMIAHEVSHYAGRRFRMCKERNDAAEKLCTIVFTEYTINYFNSQIGYDDISASLLAKRKRISGILSSLISDRANKKDREEEKYYSAFCKDLILKFSDIINSSGFMMAFDTGISISEKYLRDLENNFKPKDYSESIFMKYTREYSIALFNRELRRNVLVLLDFFLQLLKECIADVIAAAILSIDDKQYRKIMSKENMMEGDLSVFFMMIRKQIVFEILGGNEDFCDDSISYIDRFILSNNKTKLDDIEDRTDFIVVDFIKYFIKRGKLKIVFRFLDSVLSYANCNINPNNACKKKYDMVKESGHSSDYTISVL